MPGKAKSVALGILTTLILFAAQAWGFSLDDVSNKAKKLAEQNFVVPKSNLPAIFRDMKFADYQQIRFREEKAYWADDKTPFQINFYHQGMHFDVPVVINEVTATGVKEIKYEPEYFDFGEFKVDAAALQNLGFAGFKIRYPLNDSNKLDELSTFLGASYFRVVGKGQVYGLSARGLAIDTALPSGEEFPRFKEFWLERPQLDRRNLVVYALLDSPRATGAYRMVITPGSDSTVDVEAKVYLRDRVAKFGIAPLTSMFLFGPHKPNSEVDFRPALHDSNGLAIHAGNGEQIWRPLNNPKRLSVSTYTIENPRGFGLLQRGHKFSQYEDLDERYDRRPSGWVETKGDWGNGQIELIEIPTPNETNDNIVAYWSPEKLPETGQPIDIKYRLHFTIDEAAVHGPELAWVKQTRLSTGDVKQSNLTRQPDGSMAYIIDFEGPVLASLPEDTPVASQVSLNDNAELIENSVRYNPAIKGWRLTLRLKLKDATKPVEMRAALINGDKPLSETWSYQLPAYE
ncbi:glucan biosynthesis protein G [Azomonas macrocytogenes]|uniref:glucan biosynthesis protein G n=1 Tax=Azomonas macrocytogenes TaxID=69962 RepID=UPI0016062101|nr:glucan biosynthesis protein G [Azomonas macrocytogenes]